MVFSSTVFIFCFLPIVLLVSLALPRRAQNIWLLFGSLFFYAWGGVSYSIILIASLLINYSVGLLMEKYAERQKTVLFIGVALNLVGLTIFKYADFFIENINLLAGTNMALPNIKLPIGISFFTFQAISYLVDVYRKEVKVQRSLVDLSLYISLFPQLIAGPIVRYHDIAVQLKTRVKSLPLFASGVERFVIGLSKKVILANTFALLADEMFDAKPEIITPTMALLGTLAYTFQIYFDFAGYSDMAIGLGRMLGFEFKENFNFPYVAKSIQEFWRRWHISLSTWFRDYLYIPLGGNRASKGRLYFNLFIVFLCTGFWHGASWNFIIWGLFHGFFLVIERVWLGQLLKNMWAPLAQIYTLLVVIVGWIFFRSIDLNQSLIMVEKFFLAFVNFNYVEALSHLQTDLLLAFVVALMSMLGLFEKLHNAIAQVREKAPLEFPIMASKYVVLVLLFFVCLSYLSANTYNPFIYFRF